MKAVLMSIQPKWCELIANGKKTVEIRKTKPKPGTSFKVYIYCTKAKKFFTHGCIRDTLDDLYRLPNGEIKFGYSGELMCCGTDEYNEDNFLNGKVIGEFVCTWIQEYESEFVDDDCREAIASIDRDEDGDATGFFEWTNESDIPYIKTDFFKKCCVGYEDLKKYIGLGFVTFYGWHISNLVIYDEPKELSEFKKINQPCWYGEMGISKRDCHECKSKDCFIQRPPQSWCYVQEKE